MDGSSVPREPVRHGRDSTKAITATAENVAQVAAFLFLDEEQTEAAHRALDGEPMRRVIGVVDWLLQHERDEDYSPAKMLLGWAKKREAGCYRPTRGAEIVYGDREPDENGEIERSLPRGSWGRFSNEQVEANLARMERS